MKPALTLILFATLACSLPAKAQVTVVELSADAQHTAPNDLARASVHVDMQDPNPGALSARVKQSLASVLALAGQYGAVRVRTGDTSTEPFYGKNSRIEGWRMRAEVVLESRDTGQLSALLGRLRDGAVVGSIVFLTAPETRRQAEDLATQEALAVFQARAQSVAAQLGKPYRIANLNIQTAPGQLFRPPMMMMSRAASVDASPLPVAPGESTVQVVVSGRIEIGEPTAHAPKP